MTASGDPSPPKPTERTECEAGPFGTCMTHLCGGMKDGVCDLSRARTEIASLHAATERVKDALAEYDVIVHAAYLVDRLPISGTDGVEGERWFLRVKAARKVAHELVPDIEDRKARARRALSEGAKPT